MTRSHSELAMTARDPWVSGHVGDHPSAALEAWVLATGRALWYYPPGYRSETPCGVVALVAAPRGDTIYRWAAAGAQGTARRESVARAQAESAWHAATHEGDD